MSKKKDRLYRQLAYFERNLPFGARTLNALRRRENRLYRLPLGLLLVVAGVVGFLPVLGFWMLPLGLLLLSIDVPALQGIVSAVIIWARRRVTIWHRRWRAWRSR